LQATIPPARGPVPVRRIAHAIVGGVLLIGCVNIANCCSPAPPRRRETRPAGDRCAGRLVRQLLTESLVLASLGRGPCVALAWLGTRLLTAADLPLPVDLRSTRADLRVLGRAVLVTLIAGALRPGAALLAPAA
jgi:putative ABC transport system permease protein